ncbi:MAG: hypothetical protein ACXW4B_05415 [Micavibrio sp.]
MTVTAKESRLFVEKLEENLKNEGDQISLEKINPQPWDFACPVTAYSRVDKYIASAFHLNPDVLKGRSKKTYADDSEWVIAFYKKPNIVTVYFIRPIDFDYADTISPTNKVHGCIPRNGGYLSLHLREIQGQTLKKITFRASGAR